MMLNELAFFIGLLFIPFLFLFFRSLFFKFKAYKIIFRICLTLSILGVLALVVTTIEENKPNFYLFLFCPLYQFILLHFSLNIFRKYHDRDPIDPPRFSSFNYDNDRLFYFTYMILSLCLPVAIIFYCSH
jgi:hypothetical protein